MQETREEGGVCLTCNRRMDEKETAVACDGICQRWHHLSCAGLQLGQFNALKSTKKRKSKLIWLCYGCEQDFILFKAWKSMQKEIEGTRAEMNMKMNEMIAAINKLKFEYQTRTLVRNQPAAEQQAKTDETRGRVIKKSKDPAEEKTRSQEPDTQRANRQSEINNEESEEGQDESHAQADQSEEKGVETEQHTETRAEEQPTNHDEGVTEEQEGFEKLVYGRNRRRQRQQIIIGTSRESKSKRKIKKHGYISEG